MADKKPMPPSVAAEQFEQKLADCINNCGLHPLVIKMILQNVLSQVIQLERDQYQKEKDEYEKEGDS